MSQELTKLAPAPLALTIPEDERAAVMAAFAVNFASGSITEFDLPRIKVMNGAALWLIPALDGDATEPAIEGVIVAAHDVRVYYPKKNAGSVPPDCSSNDLITGQGKPGGNCSTCPMAQFGSAPDDGAGQACKHIKQLFMLRGTSMLPEVVSIPPTSLKAVRQFFLKLVTQRVQYHHCIIRIELEKAKNSIGQEYGKAVMRMIRRLSPEEIARAEEMRQFVESFAVRVTPSAPVE